MKSAISAVSWSERLCRRISFAARLWARHHVYSDRLFELLQTLPRSANSCPMGSTWHQKTPHQAELNHIERRVSVDAHLYADKTELPTGLENEPLKMTVQHEKCHDRRSNFTVVSSSH